MRNSLLAALMTPLLVAGTSLAAQAGGDQPGGGGPSANVPAVGAGGSGPTDTNIGTGGRNELRDRFSAPPVILVPGAGFGGGAGMGGQGGGVALPQEGTAPTRRTPAAKQ
jgi:hypothetical protein